MGPICVSVLLIFGIGCLASGEGTNAERCQKLTSLATSFIEELSTMDDFDKFLNMTRGALNIDVTDPEVREEILCKVADAKTVRDLYVAMPDLTVPFEIFAAVYKQFQTSISERFGGYTNIFRFLRIRSDIRKWRDQLFCGNSSLPEVTDLPTLTHFLEVMQVRYGSRWMSYIAASPNQGVLVENATAFAEKLYGCLTSDAETNLERYQKLQRIATTALEELSTLDGYEEFLNRTEHSLNFDITDKDARESLLRRIADARTLHELYEALPKLEGATFEGFASSYKSLKEHLIRDVGGYTNLPRVHQMVSDIWKWQRQLKSGDSLQEVTDLPSLTHYLEVMQVKYGSRWMSHFTYVPYQSLLVENPKEFAEEIYYAEEPVLTEAIANLTGLDKNHVGYLAESFSKPLNEKTYENEKNGQRGLEITAGVMIRLGDMGYLNLE